MPYGWLTELRAVYPAFDKVGNFFLKSLNMHYSECLMLTILCIQYILKFIISSQ